MANRQTALALFRRFFQNEQPPSLHSRRRGGNFQLWAAARVLSGYAFVANQGEQSIAVVDLTTFSVARQIRLEAAPSAIAADGQRRAVYVLAHKKG